MVGFKKILLVFTLSLCAGAVFGQVDTGSQNVTNSPYTRYGYGELSDNAFGKSKAMGGLAYGIRDRYQLNPANPASYTAMDSLTFLFEGGFTLQNTNFSDGINKTNAKNSSFDYVAMQFRLKKWMAINAGFIPYSNVGYSISKSDVDHENTDAYNVSSFQGDGGLKQLYLGVGVNVLKNLAIGANFSYFWGDIDRSMSLYFPATSASTNTESEEISISDFKIDLGAQYTYNISDKRQVVLGAVYSPKRSLNNTTTLRSEVWTNQVGRLVAEVDSTATFETPHKLGLGFTYMYDNRLTVGLDYTLEKWGSVTYFDNPNAFRDRSKVVIGAEYRPSHYSRNYLAHVRYRMGGYYSTPYYKINGQNAATEYGVSIGLGLPLPKVASLLNLSAQYVRVNGKKSSFLDENYLKVSIGLTFNERWFFKRKVN